MESVTYQEFRKKSGEMFTTLVSIIIFMIYKLFSAGYDLEYMLIGFIAIFGLIAVSRLRSITMIALNAKEYKMSGIDHFVTGHVLMAGLGALSFYIFFVKGLYGVYLLFENFSWFLLFFRLIIIILSYRLVLSVSIIQTV